MSFNQDLEKGKIYENNSNNSSAELNQQPTLHPIQTVDDNNATGGKILRVTTSSAGDIIYLGDHAYHKHELLNAFGGAFASGLHPAPHRPMGNPVPLGLVGFSICTFVVGMVFVEARGLTNPQLLASAGLFLGGGITTICGLWCLIIENTFAATALGAFGGFYLSYAGILMNAFGIKDAYADEPKQFNDVMGFFLTAWTIYAFSMWLCTFKSTWSFFLIIGFIVCYLFLLTIGYFIDNMNVKKGAGVFAILSSLCGFYAIFEGVATPQNSYVTCPNGLLPNAPRV